MLLQIPLDAHPLPRYPSLEAFSQRNDGGRGAVEYSPNQVCSNSTRTALAMGCKIVTTECVAVHFVWLRRKTSVLNPPALLKGRGGSCRGGSGIRCCFYFSGCRLRCTLGVVLIAVLCVLALVALLTVQTSHHTKKHI